MADVPSSVNSNPCISRRMMRAQIFSRSIPTILFIDLSYEKSRAPPSNRLSSRPAQLVPLTAQLTAGETKLTPTEGQAKTLNVRSGRLDSHQGALHPGRLGSFLSSLTPLSRGSDG